MDSPEPDPRPAALRAAWAELYDQYSISVWRYVARLVGPRADVVGDTVQETFLSAARAFDQYDPDRGTQWAWLATIAHRQVALYWRQQNRERREALPMEEVSADVPPDAPLQRAETIDVVRQVLAELPSEAAAVLVGKYADDCSVADLVEQFGGTQEAMRSRLARARRSFKQRFQQLSPQSSLASLSKSEPNSS